MTPVSRIANARVVDETTLVDIVLADGRIAAITPAGADAAAPGDTVVDADGGLACVPFAEPHFHADKGFSRAATTGASGHDAALDLKAGFTVDDVAARALRAFEEAIAAGVSAMRVNVDVDAATGLTGFAGLLAARETIGDRLAVQISPFPQEGLLDDPRVLRHIEEALAGGADAVGGWPNGEATRARQLEHIETVFALAQRFELPVNIEVDEELDPTQVMLEAVAEATLRHGLAGRILVTHCCALETYDDEHAARVADLAGRAGLAICLNPLNLTWGGLRGLSRIDLLAAAGVTLTTGSDNVVDGYNPIGNLDPIDRARMVASAAARLDPAVASATVWGMTTSGAQRALQRPDTLAPGSAADLMVFPGCTHDDVLLGEPSLRIDIRGGRRTLAVSQTCDILAEAHDG